ncbi:MAG: hypothetical protein LBB45_00695 [Methanobrevibacter sp.]|jgi:hypothetical protein|nr:hypothetical protein [Candidatus Methanovirga basalitermitum]
MSRDKKNSNSEGDSFKNKDKVDESHVTSEENDKNPKYEFFISEKIYLFLKNDMEKRYPIVAILGIVFGLILVIIAIISFFGNSEKIVDNVNMKENGMFSVLIGLFGLVILGLSTFRLLTKKTNLGHLFKSLEEIDSPIFNEEKPKTSKEDSKIDESQKDKNKRKNDNHISQNDGLDVPIIEETVHFEVSRDDMEQNDD